MRRSVVPEQSEVDDFLPPPVFPDGYPGTFDLARPKAWRSPPDPGITPSSRLGSTGPCGRPPRSIRATAQRLSAAFGRGCTGLVEGYRSEDAEFILVTLGSIAGTVRVVVDELRASGRDGRADPPALPAALPDRRVDSMHCSGRSGRPRCWALGVLEKDISFGHQGSVSAGGQGRALRARRGAGVTALPGVNFVAGLGGQDVAGRRLPTALPNWRQGRQTQRLPSRPGCASSASRISSMITIKNLPEARIFRRSQGLRRLRRQSGGALDAQGPGRALCRRDPRRLHVGSRLHLSADGARRECHDRPLRRHRGRAVRA